jgi:tetratricopeptide (TPR) repeat protein
MTNRLLLPRVALFPFVLLSLAALAGCGRAPEPGSAAAPAAGPAAQAKPAAAPAAPVERPRSVGEIESRAVHRPPVLFIGLDGADWQQLDPMIERGEMPNLAKLRAQSAWGELETQKPPLSPLLWTSMMTGVTPVEHGILDFSRFQPGTGVREPITSDERKVPALWNLTTWAGKKTDVLGLWATYPAEAVDGVLVSDRLFGFLNMEEEPPAGAIYPPEREAWAKQQLARVWKETGYDALREYLPWLTEAEYREHAESERPYDHPISALRRILVETRLYDALADDLLSGGVPDLFVVYLQGTDSIGHVFAPFAPPRQDAISESDYERYKDVPDRYFREIDGVLGRWMAAADRSGAVIVVVSDHGFYWGEGRPEELSSFANATAAKWHRPEGIWLVRGAGPPGRGERYSQLRVFSTLVSLLGLPAAEGVEPGTLDGVPPPAKPAYDYARVFRELAARRPRPEAASAGTKRSADEEIAKLQALGYIGSGEPTQAPEAARASGSTRTAGSYNNEGILRRGDRDDAGARAAFEKAIEIDPNLASALWNLSDLLYAEKQYDRSDELLVRAVHNRLPEGAKFLIGRAIGYQRAGELGRSVALLDRAVEARPEEKEYWLFRGRYRVESHDCRGALSDFERAAELAPEDPAVFASEALAHLCLDDREGAISAFRRSLELNPDQPQLRALLARVVGGG